MVEREDCVPSVKMKIRIYSVFGLAEVLDKGVLYLDSCYCLFIVGAVDSLDDIPFRTKVDVRQFLSYF